MFSFWFKQHEVFTQKLEGLNASHEFRRSIRGDGHCFYRSIIFGFLEYFITTGDIDGKKRRKIIFFHTMIEPSKAWRKTRQLKTRYSQRNLVCLGLVTITLYFLCILYKHFSAVFWKDVLTKIQESDLVFLIQPNLLFGQFKWRGIDNHDYQVWKT